MFITCISTAELLILLLLHENYKTNDCSRNGRKTPYLLTILDLRGKGWKPTALQDILDVAPVKSVE
jgi:hypothetical protein